MTRVSAEVEVLLADVVRTATHSHNPPYGRALLIEEILGVVESALVGPKYPTRSAVASGRSHWKQ